MENFLTLTLSILLFMYLYLYSFKLNSFFKNAKSYIFTITCICVFTLLLLAVLFVFIDVMTTSTNKNFLNFKQHIALNFLCFLEVTIMLIFPTLYVCYLVKETSDKPEEREEIETNKKEIKKYITFYWVYLMSIVSLNVFYIKLSPYFYNQFPNNNGFAEKVPEALSSYGKMETDYEKVVYFNFGLLMMVGKFLGFTYMPYGMGKYVYDLIYPVESPVKESQHVEKEKEYGPNSNSTHDIIHIASKPLGSSENLVVISNHSKSSSDFFSNDSENSKNVENIEQKLNKSRDSKLSKKSKSLEEKNSHSDISNNSILTHISVFNDQDDEENSLIRKPKRNAYTVEEYLNKLAQSESNEKFNKMMQAENLHNINEQTNNLRRKLSLSVLHPLSSTILNTFYNLYIVFSIFIIFGIIYTKITILYIKLMYNICGTECGLLAYRFDDVISLETITGVLSNFSQNLNSMIKFDFLFFAFLLLFRALTVFKSFSLKGISFMWKIFYKPDSDMISYHIIQIYGTILFTGIVLLYDFTYLLPDYIRFNGLDPVCDYTLINKSYCGVSFYGLLFIKISMNFHIFMYWDIIASGVFITNGIIWSFRLIVRPLFNSLLEKMGLKNSIKEENKNLKMI
jgi:hypothetical protein